MDVEKLDALLQQMTPHQKKLIQAVYDVGDKWASRTELARVMGKKRLTPYDFECLRRLAEQGIVLLETRESKGPGSDFAYIYKMSSDVAQLFQRWSEYVSSRKPPARPPVNIKDYDPGELVEAGQSQ